MTDSLYWRSGLWVESGDLVTPSWGRVICGLGGAHDLFGREMVLELVRRDAAPELPSRLGSMFAFDDLERAKAWNDGGVRNLLYRVRLADEATPRATLDMAIMDEWESLHDAGQVLEWARRYWSATMHDGSWPEVLVGGSLIIEERL